MITWNEYQQQALTTAIYPLSRELDYTILGLCSEVGELGTAYFTTMPDEVLAELGDCFWYAAAIADALKLPLQTVATFREETVHPLFSIYPSGNMAIMLQIVAEASAMAGILKKAIRDNEGFVEQAHKDKITFHLFRLLWLMDALCHKYETTRYAVMSANLNKLADRKARGVLQGSGDHR